MDINETKAKTATLPDDLVLWVNPFGGSPQRIGIVADFQSLADDHTALKERLAMATCFELVSNHGWLTGESNQRPVNVELRPQRDGERKWVVKMHEWVLAKDGQFIWEPQPSSRTDEFIALTRFDSVDAALSAFAALQGEGEKR